MRRIDPDNVVVLVRDSSDAIVRIGVSSWQDLREVIRPVQADPPVPIICETTSLVRLV